MAIHALRGSIRKVSIAAQYVSTLPATVPVFAPAVVSFNAPSGLVQTLPAIVPFFNQIEGGISAMSAVANVASTDQRPSISLVGESVVTLPLGSAFFDPGAVVKDDSDPERQVFAKGSVNTAVVGSYTLTYEAADSSRMLATPISRVVNVVGRPAPSIVSMDVLPRKVTVTAGASPRKITVLLSNNDLGTVNGTLRAESGSDSLVVPEELSFSARGKSRGTAPPRVTRVPLPVSASPERTGETTVTLRCGELTSRFTVVFK